jgi:hypothetical protein
MPGKRYDRLRNRVREEYIRKGKGPEEAERIANATAAKIWREKEANSEPEKGDEKSE